MEVIEWQPLAQSPANVFRVHTQDPVAFELDIPVNNSIITNRAALTQIVTNLFSSAVEAIPEKETVEVVGNSR